MRQTASIQSEPQGQVATGSGPLGAAFAVARTALFPAPDVVAWVAIGITAVATATLMAVDGLSFDWTSATRPVLACIAVLGGAVFYRTWRPDERIAASLVAVAQLIAFTAVAATFSYAVASTGGAYWDDAFASWDRALGLDWRAYLETVNAHPWVSLIYRLAYQSLMVQFVAAAGLLGLTGRFARCRTFVSAVAIAGFITIVISGLLPAEGLFAHLGLHASDYPNVDLQGGYSHLPPLHALRAGTLHVISLTSAEGIIAFPSFHTALGVIFLRAFWSIGWARWPGAILNMMLIAATPLGGCHYFVDIIAGAAVAVVSLTVANRFEIRA